MHDVVLLLCVWADVGQEGYDNKKQLEELIHVAGLCIELLQQNDEYLADVSLSVSVSVSVCLSVCLSVSLSLSLSLSVSLSLSLFLSVVSSPRSLCDAC